MLSYVNSFNFQMNFTSVLDYILFVSEDVILQIQQQASTFENEHSFALATLCPEI